MVNWKQQTCLEPFSKLQLRNINLKQNIIVTVKIQILCYSIQSLISNLYEWISGQLLRQIFKEFQVYFSFLTLRCFQLFQNVVERIKIRLKTCPVLRKIFAKDIFLVFYFITSSSENFTFLFSMKFATTQTTLCNKNNTLQFFFLLQQTTFLSFKSNQIQKLLCLMKLFALWKSEAAIYQTTFIWFDFLSYFFAVSGFSENFGLSICLSV